jgi:hypothetical protein
VVAALQAVGRLDLLGVDMIDSEPVARVSDAHFARECERLRFGASAELRLALVRRRALSIARFFRRQPELLRDMLAAALERAS